MMLGPPLFRFDDWHEEDGDALWWRFPVSESPYCGSPIDTAWPFKLTNSKYLFWHRFPSGNDVHEIAKAMLRKEIPIVRTLDFRP
jgi:hypothetical protein